MLRHAMFALLSALPAAAFAQSSGAAESGVADRWWTIAMAAGLARALAALAALAVFWAVIWYPAATVFSRRSRRGASTTLGIPAILFVVWTLSDVRGEGLGMWIVGEGSIAVALTALLLLWPARLWPERAPAAAHWCRILWLVAMGITFGRFAAGYVSVLHYPSFG
jgi:hypothetical protein